MQDIIKKKNKISILIPVYDNIRYTLLCLKAIERYTPEHIDYQVVIIDDCSADKVEDILPGMAPEYIRKRLVILRNERNLGFAQSVNRAVKETRGGILLLLNNDVFVTKGWLEPLLSALDKGDGDIIGSKLLYPDGTIQHAGGVFYFDEGQKTTLSYHIYRGFPRNFAGVNKQRRFNWITFACVMLTRRVFEDMGGLDEAFLNSYEDADICLRAVKKGYSVLYEPGSIAYHLECATRGYGNPRDIINHRLFMERHKVIPDDDFRYYIEDGIPIHLGREFSSRQFPVGMREYPYKTDVLIEILEQSYNAER
ncbi:MAG: glycosyltransferase [Nitrospirae bacterium]|nr:glycosyltransferase [Nitrospirota bacterium]